jgi:glycerol-3-phosphate dehydrogenase (NAD(P)+)
MTEGTPRVAVIGSGAWGTTLALLVARTEPVTLLCHAEETAARLRQTRRNGIRLPGIELPEAIQPTADPAALAGAELVIVAVPSSYVRATVAHLASAIPAGADVLSVVKGLEHGTLLRMTEVIAHAAGIDPARLAALSGPNRPRDRPRAPRPWSRPRIRARRSDRGPPRPPQFRLYTNTDVLGAELCGPSRTSSPSPPGRPTASASATTVRPGS